MKDSGNKLAPKNKFLGGKNCDWIGEIPDNWKIIRLKYLGTLKNGLTYSPSDITDKDKGTLVLRSSNIQNSKLVFNDNVYVSCKIPNNLFVKNNDILICSRNGSRELIGKNAIIENINATYGAFMMVYRCKYPKFMYYVLNSNIFSYYIGTFFTSTINQLTIANFNNMKIPLPPLEEQQQIADFLDNKCSKIDKLLELLTKQIKVLSEYKKSLITETVTKGLNPDKLAPSTKEEKHWKYSGNKLAPKNKFLGGKNCEWIGEIPDGWKIIRLKYICKITTGDEDTQNADNDGEYLFYVRSPIIEHSKRYTFEGESILMAGDGAGAGRIFHHAFGKYAVHQRVYILYNFSYNSSFLYYFLSNMFPQEMDRGSAQTTVPSVRLPMILNFKIALPPLEEQQEIADFLDNKCSKIDKLLENKKKQIETLKKYKKSLIYEYVTGKKELTYSP